MILVVGGAGQGKLDYVKREYQVTQQEISSQLGDSRVVYGLHEVIRRLHDLDRAVDIVFEHAQAHPDAIYICDEIGCGVVPLAPEERLWRQAVGQVCVMLGQRAQRVVRIFCGIPMELGRRDKQA